MFPKTFSHKTATNCCETICFSTILAIAKFEHVLSKLMSCRYVGNVYRQLQETLHIFNSAFGA